MAEELPLRVALARVVQAQRAQRGLTQEDFGFLCGLHPKHVGRWEQEAPNVTLKTVGKLLAGTGLSLRELAGLVEDEQRRQRPIRSAT